MRRFRTTTGVAFALLLPLSSLSMASGGTSLLPLSVAPGEIRYRLESQPIELSRVEIGGESFDSFDLEGAPVIGASGEPGMPAYTAWIPVPAGMVPRLEAACGGETVIEGVRLAPVPTLESDNPNVASTNLINRDSSPVEGIFPADWATLGDPIEIGGERFALLTATPYRYDAAAQRIIKADHLDIRVGFDPGGASSPSSRSVAPVWREVARALADSPVRDDLSPRADNIGHLVIIIPNSNGAEEAIAPLVEWKRQKGYLVTLERLGGDVGQSVESILDYLRTGWAEWTYPPDFVLLAGDAEGDLRMPFWRDGQNRMASWYVSDNPFVTFEGDNQIDRWIPEALIGRLPAASVAELGQMVRKIIGYERTPYMERPWVEGALLIAAGVHSCIETNVAVRELMTNVGYNRNRCYEAYSEYHAGQQIDQNIVNNGVDAGVGFVNFRGYNNWGNISVGQIRERRNGWKLPVVTGMVCATNDFANNQAESIGEAWLRAWNANDPRGAVACWGPTDLYTHTWFNNTLDGEFYHLLLNRGVHTLGALTLGARLSLIRNYPSSLQLGGGTSVGYYFYTYTLFGDPSMQVWSREPHPIEVEFESDLPAGETMLNFRVTGAQAQAIPNAYVHLYLDEDHRYGGFTGEDGTLSLNTPPLAAGTYSLVVTGANLAPAIEEVTVSSVDLYAAFARVDYDDDNDGDSRGNGDGLVNPGETIELTPTFRNTGNENLDALTARLESESPYVEIVVGSAEFGGIAAEGEASTETPLLIRVAPETPDGARIEFTITAANRGEVYASGFLMPVTGYQFYVSEQRFPDRELATGSASQLALTIVNRGSLDALPLQGELFCSHPGIQIRESTTRFPEVASGSEAANDDRPFVIFAGAQAYDGSVIDFGLRLSDENGVGDSLRFSVAVGEPSAASPQGPDSYGYWAYDSRDTASGMAPRYERLTGNTSLNLQDNDDAATPTGVGGSSRVIDLPFEFRFYGEPFRRATVGTNGWMAFGESSLIIWNNQELGSPLAPGGMIAPYWQDLNGGQVYTSYDRNNARFIVEWRDYRYFGQQISFSVVLYDPTVVPTQTGDGEIVVEYIAIPDMRDIPDEGVTIGLCSPDRNVTLTIAHGPYINPLTAGLRSQRAVRFTTGPETEVGSLQGTVTDFTDNSPMANVRVMIDGTGFFAVTDTDGNYRIDGIVAGSYSVTARKPFFNEGRSFDVSIRTDETETVDFILTHPTFNIDAEEIEASCRSDSTASRAFNVWNEGNGPLDYRIRLEYSLDGRDAPWDSLYNWNVSDITDDNRIYGAAVIRDEIYLSGPRTVREFPHMIYVLNRAGDLVRSFEQFTVDSSTNRGYLSIEPIGGNLLAVEMANVLEVTTEGELVRVIPTPYNPAQVVAYAPDRETIFVCSITGDVYFELDMNGNEVGLVRTPSNDYRTYGLAWHPADPDGFNLYIAHDMGNVEEFGTRLVLMKMNVETGEARIVRPIILEAGDVFQDIDISKTLNPLIWTLSIGLNRQSGKRLVGFELGPNLTWIDYEPESGSVQAGENQQFTIDFYPADLPDGLYSVALNLSHNAVGERIHIPVAFTVGVVGAPPLEIAPPARLSLAEPFPNPFNGTTRISFSLPAAAVVRLGVYDLSGREFRRLVDGRRGAGSHQIVWDGADASAGIYLLKLEAGGESAARKVVMVR